MNLKLEFSALTLALFFCTVGAMAAPEQEAAQLDATSVAHEPAKIVATRSGVSSGSSVPNKWHTDQLKLEIANLDRNLYRPGEPVVFELKLTNQGTQPVVLPWGVQRADVEPAGVSSFEFVLASCSLGVPTGKFTRAALPGAIFLYGSDLQPTSLLTLRPGEWATLRGRAVMLQDLGEAGATEANNWTAEVRAMCSVSLNRVHVKAKEISEFAFPVEGGVLRSASKNIKLQPSPQ